MWFLIKGHSLSAGEPSGRSSTVGRIGAFLTSSEAVSYTHLDVYKRQQYKDIVAFSLLVLILLFRPTGLLGKPEVEKV